MALAQWPVARGGENSHMSRLLGDSVADCLLQPLEVFVNDANVFEMHGEKQSRGVRLVELCW